MQTLYSFSTAVQVSMKTVLAALVLCCQTNLIQAADNAPAIPLGCVVFKRAVDAGATFVEYRSFKDFGTTIVVINTTGDEARVFGYYEPIFIPYPSDQAADRQKTLSLLQLARKTYPDMTRRLALVEKAWAEAPVRTVPAPAVPQATIAVGGTEIVTTNGTRYSNARVTRVDGDLLTIAHDTGFSRVRFMDLPDDVRKKYGVAATLSAATKEKPFVNTLGMKFVPVQITGGPTGGKRVLFSVWATRVQDYAVYAAENVGLDMRWKNVEEGGEKQGPTHPVVNVNWDEAKAFCAWLTKKDRMARMLGPNEEYRLPSDHEWSCAVGIGEREDPIALPRDKRGKIPALYTWGSAWPPPKGAGNYRGEGEALSDFAKEYEMKGYRDGYKFTSPVGSFTASRNGLYDMGGNVVHWCEDWFDSKKELRVMRGDAWNSCKDDVYPYAFLASNRDYMDPTVRIPRIGFRVVIVGWSSASGHTTPSPASVATPALKLTPQALVNAATSSATLASASKEDPFVNRLGMKFVPVPITGGLTDGKRVLFSVWDTRVQDYAVYAAENPGVDMEWKDAQDEGEKQGPTHPVVNVNWDEAKAFCAWLTKKDRMARMLGPNEEYRLPSDHEWSCAAGIGEREDPNAAPISKNGKIPGVYPWGNAWPPPKGAGNYQGEGEALSAFFQQFEIKGYRDGYRFTSPVGSFNSNRYGLYDMGGNVWQWTEDWHEPLNARFSRGASYRAGSPGDLLSSYRIPTPHGMRNEVSGFRIIVVCSSSGR
jgi:formylglycine-generating enzyme required for sulfatase activity